MTTILFARDPDANLATLLDRARSLPPLAPFSPDARRFVADFTRRILALPQLRQFPELATLSHWFRPAALDHLARKATEVEDGLTLPRGLVFHLAPANVDVLFAYAWLMSLLCGNRNIARLSQKPGAQRDAMIGILNAMQAAGEHPEVLERTILLTYPHDDAITRQISAHCHARVVWGGDATVAKIRSIPLAPLALEVVFPDRFGIAVFKAAKVSALTAQEAAELGRRFCNDMLWFGQQACSSPRSLYWVGTQTEIAAAKEVFWPAVRTQATQFADETAAMMARVTDAFLLASIAPDVNVEDGMAAYPMRLATTSTDGHMREMQSGHGLLVEVELASLDALGPQLDDRDQTLVQCGFNAGEISALLVQLGNRAIDRVVPVGRALDFHHVWDGTDLFKVLTRQTTIAAG